MAPEAGRNVPGDGDFVFWCTAFAQFNAESAALLPLVARDRVPASDGEDSLAHAIRSDGI